MKKDIALLTIRENNSIKEAIQCIDDNSQGIALIVDENIKLLGVVTDGDIRRAILSGKSLSTPIREVMHREPLIAREGTTATELLAMMLETGIRQVPIVTDDGIVMDMAVVTDLKSVPLSSPDITYREVELINQVLATPYLSIGPKIEEFEAKIARYIGTKYAVAVNSGTSALHLCTRSLDIKDGDEVITTPFSFISSANCILFERAKPVFVDIDEDSLCIDVTRIEEKITERTKAILPVHIFGHACQMDKVMEIGRKYNLAVIEDACEAIGGEYSGEKVGSFGDCGVFAFYPNKQITTAEGGMVVTNDEKIARLCRSMRNQGRDESGSWLSHERLGYNYRMNELSASLGTVQMDRIDEILEKRQEVADFYNKRLSHMAGIIIPYIAPNVKMSWFVYVIRLDSTRFSQEDRDRVMKELGARGINSRAYFPPIHLEPFYVNKFGYGKGLFPVTEKVSGLTIALPFFNNLEEQEVDYICSALEKIIGL